MSSMLQERDILLEPWFSIKLKGQTLGDDMLQYVQQVQVEEEEDKLPLASINIFDPKKIWLNDRNIVKDATITIYMGHKNNHRLMFDGKITHIDPDYPQDGDPTLTIVAIDKGLKLQEDKKSRSFKKAKVSDVVKIMLKECGLTGEVQDTGSVLAHVPQESETNLEFITRWRKKLGWKFEKLGNGGYYFGAERKNSGVIKTLGYKTGGMEIVSFTPSFQEHETTGDKTSDVDNDGKVTEYTVRNVKNTVVYPGLKDSKLPVAKV